MTGSKPVQARIARIWRGRTMRAKGDDYAVYLRSEGVTPLLRKALGAQMFREDRETETEFVTISHWESVEAMSRLPGPIRAASTICPAMPSS